MLKEKNEMEFVFILISITCILPGILPHSTCSIHICLRWTSRQDMFKIVCKIDDLHLPVYINNNLGVEIARCSIPFPFPLCITPYTNTIVEQNMDTNETVVIVKGRIDRYINGNWSCRHGVGRNKFEAAIEINIPQLKEQNKSAGNDEFRCMKEIAFYTMTGVVLSVVLFSIFLFLKCKCKSTGKKKHFKRINRFSKEIDACFESKRCETYSVMNIKIAFFTSFVLLVLISGVLIGIFEKDSCLGSSVYIFLGIVLCLTLFILFIRFKGIEEEHQDDQVDEGGINLVAENLSGAVDERANG